jgi:predicted nucleic acid-binding protein
MKLVIDTNILFSLMNPGSVNSYIFSLLDDMHAPSFILEELEEHREEYLIKSGLSRHEFNLRLKEVTGITSFYDNTSYKTYLLEARRLTKDLDDIEFVALALDLDAAIWSNDAHFSPSKVKVLRTADLLKTLLDG